MDRQQRAVDDKRRHSGTAVYAQHPHFQRMGRRTKIALGLTEIVQQHPQTKPLTTSRPVTA